jgi:mannose-6-phosphate isomerase-like protein (cupin superfamily)
MSICPEKTDLLAVGRRLDQREEHIVSRVEDMNIYVTSYHGQYDAHKHPKDEFFFVLEGELEVDFNGSNIVLRKGEGITVPRETVHKPNAKSRAIVMKIEPVDFPFEKV